LILRLVAIGLVSGFVSALFGVGGGVIIVPLLLLWVRFDVRKASATSLLAIGMTAIAGVAIYAGLGEVRPGYAALVGIPAAFGAVVGASLAERLHAQLLEYLFAALLVAVAGWLAFS
jgi:uncharacterized membrane protein YfcA